MFPQKTMCGTPKSPFPTELTQKSTIQMRHKLDLSGKHSARLQLLREDYSLTFPPLSITRYSLIQPSQLGRCGEEKYTNFEKGIQTLALSIESRRTDWAINICLPWTDWAIVYNICLPWTDWVMPSVDATQE